MTTAPNFIDAAVAYLGLNSSYVSSQSMESKPGENVVLTISYVLPASSMMPIAKKMNEMLMHQNGSLIPKVTK